ncbi:MAG: DNA polymerase IV [Saprospiraceae bacterium]|nr:DNA polymerase IV [Saprospiraceae bacterium]
MTMRSILHLDLDAFFVAVECLRNDSLRGKPLIIGGSSNRGVVASCSYEARAFGVRSAMPMRQALLLCPDALVLRGDMDAYSKHSALVREVIADQAPLFEQASIDEFYLDLTGMDKYFGCWKWSGELRERIIRETGLPLSMGLSVNKTVSKVGAGEVKPNGAQLIPAGDEKAFLAPLPVGKIPLIGKETERRLTFMGVRNCQTLAEMPPRLLEREFGKPGITMWKRANGEDNSPVVPYREQDSMSSERTFHTDTIDLNFLHSEIRKQTAQLAYELRALGKLTACITVKLRYADFQTFSKQAKIPYTAQDTALTQHALDLFNRLYERRQAIRLVGVRFSELAPGASQLQLFNDTEKEARLLDAMDKIRNRFGKKAVGRG